MSRPVLPQDGPILRPPRAPRRAAPEASGEDILSALEQAHGVYRDMLLAIKQVHQGCRSESGESFAALGKLAAAADRLEETTSRDLSMVSAMLHRTTAVDPVWSHCANTAIVAMGILRQLKVPAPKRRLAVLAAFLHDLGAETPATAVAEFPAPNEAAAALLERVSDRDAVALDEITTILDRMNGTGKSFSTAHAGTPDGLARVLDIAGLFEALIHPRGPATARLPHDAMKFILGRFPHKTDAKISEEIGRAVSPKRQQGPLFETELLKVLLATLTLHPPGSFVQLSTKEIASVERIDPAFPTRPTVRIWVEKNRRISPPGNFADLRHHPTTIITRPVDPLEALRDSPEAARLYELHRIWIA